MNAASLVAVCGGGLGGAVAALVGRRFGDDAAAPQDHRGALVAGAAIGAGMVLWEELAPGAVRLPDIAFGLTLLALALVDLSTMRLPDVLTLPLAAAGLLLCAVQRPEALAGHVLAALGAYALLAGIAGVYRRVRGRDGLGLGDAKLLAAGGAWLGWRPLPLVVLGACALTLAWFAARALRRGRGALEGPLPLGPALCAALWVAAVYAAD